MLCEYGCNQEAKYQFKNGKWCCSSHSSKCPFLKNKIKNKIKNLYQSENNPYTKETNIIRSKSLKKAWENKNNKWHTKETKEKQKNANLEYRKRKDCKYNTKEFKKKLSEKHKDIWKDLNSSYNSKERNKKISITMKKLYKDPIFLKKYQESIKVKPNRPETLLLEFLKPFGYKFVGDGKLWINGKNPDFINQKNNLIIEFFGDYWHSEEKTGLSKKEHELERIKIFKKENFETLVIWESELNNLKLLKKRIINFNKELI